MRALVLDQVASSLRVGVIRAEFALEMFHSGLERRLGCLSFTLRLKRPSKCHVRSPSCIVKISGGVSFANMANARGASRSAAST